MLVIYQNRIYREDLKSNPSLLYLFGDNNLRTGYGGQAKEMRGEVNAHGIRTKIEPSNEDGAFMSDESFRENIDMINIDLTTMMRKFNKGSYKGIVIPYDGLGTGLSDMPNRCPKTFQALVARLALSLNKQWTEFPWMKAYRSA